MNLNKVGNRFNKKVSENAKEDGNIDDNEMGSR